jgi:hypothetical protein
MLTIVHLAYLYNEFIVQALLEKEDGGINTKLLKVSMELMSTALKMGRPRDRNVVVHRDFTRAVGFPCSLFIFFLHK